ncbi:MAG: Ni/Fe hydrogenase subunit alpha [Pseudomonadota bacterium]|nr:Ni/Fe hydrogenase subunit alpha [Pseudomonadota bacterium]
MNESVNLNVPILTRVEGEGGLELTIQEQKIEQVKLRIFEPPRFFEKFLEGRHYNEVADMVARICGLCPIAYQMSTVHAIESIFELDPGPWVRAMRRLIYCGEWLESHAVHIHLLAAPDFLGYTSAPAMAEHYPDELRRGLHLQEIGNDIIRMLGGRSVHPVGVKVGGFYRAPTLEQVAKLHNKIRQALPLAEELVHWTASLGVPDNEQQFINVSLRHPAEYPFNEGHITVSNGLEIPISEYEQHFAEFQVPHSTALQAHFQGQPYLVGPLARLNLNLDRLPAAVRHNLERTAIEFPSRNMFHSIIARAVEIHFALVEALQILDDYRLPECPYATLQPRAGVGFGATEAPRGLLWQKWAVDETGSITSARIVPPTSQNQARIEEDIRLSLEAMGLEHSDEALRTRSEMVVRNYDPCISCATHFLKLTVHRT